MRSKCLFFILIMIFAVSCHKEDDVIIYTRSHTIIDKEVAVLAPLSDSIMKKRLGRTAEWFASNYLTAQASDSVVINLKISWYDENTEDLAALGESLSEDDEVLAVIGPFDNAKVAVFAPYCQRTLKPLILPTATSEEVLRRFAPPTDSGNRTVKPFLWALTSSDVKLCETVLDYFATFCKYYDYFETAPQGMVYSPDDVYGKTFFDWIPFFATNFEISVAENSHYVNGDQLADKIFKWLKTNCNNWLTAASFCVVEDVEDIYKVAYARRKYFNEDPLFFDGEAFDTKYDDNTTFSQVCPTYFVIDDICDEYVESMDTRAQGILQQYKGYSPYADPSTGFELSYQTRFGTKPAFAECKLYDALLLTGICAYYMEHTGEQNFNSAVTTITVEHDGALSSPCWDGCVLERYLHGLLEGEVYNFTGASGRVCFDKENFLVNIGSTYVNWQIKNGRIVHHTYFGGEGKYNAKTTAAWQIFYDESYLRQMFDEMAEEYTGASYPSLDDKYAVIVHASEGFANYRHLADALSVYQALKSAGFDDEHILLIADPSVANDSHNPEPGVVRSSKTGADLMKNVVVDYDASTLSANDVEDLIKTNVPKSPNTNVLLYWSGHGSNGEFTWRGKSLGGGFSAEMLRETVNSLVFRKMLVIAEPCYSESVIKALDGCHGVLAISGAAQNEQSWADNWNEESLFWMSDRFTKTMLTCLAGNPSISYNELYIYCSQHTLGSHVKIVNAANFGSLYMESPDEFFRY